MLSIPAMEQLQPAWPRVSAWTPVMAIAAGLMWAVVRPLQEDHPAPFTYDQWNRLMTVDCLLFFGATAAIRRILALHMGKLGRLGFAVSLIGSALLIAGNVVEFWLSFVLNVPTAFDAGYAGAGWPGSYWGWGLFIVGCLILAGAAGILAIALLRAPEIRWWLTLPLALSQLFLVAFFRPGQSAAFGLMWVALGLAMTAIGTRQSQKALRAGRLE